jgi:hypothetical protein
LEAVVMDPNKQTEEWQLPIARALVAMKRLPGLARGRVGFDQVRLAGQPWGLMNTAVVHAYLPADSVPFAVRFAVQGGSYVVRDHGGRSLTARGVAAELGLPPASAHRAFFLLRGALTQALQLYNRAHTAQGRSPHAPAAGASEPWPFRARPAGDAPAGPSL